jgi:CheY-like chemotaxis protein
MKQFAVAPVTFALGLLLATPAHACGEGQFNMGQGLRYQGYLAPRPATVLIYDDGAVAPERKALYAGLQRAGHHVTVVRDAGSLSRALDATRYDVVISDLADADAIATRGAQAAARPPLLPVVERSARNQPALRRFHAFLLDGASLGQYLKAINQLLAVRAS